MYGKEESLAESPVCGISIMVTVIDYTFCMLLSHCLTILRARRGYEPMPGIGIQMLFR